MVWVKRWPGDHHSHHFPVDDPATTASPDFTTEATLMDMGPGDGYGIDALLEYDVKPGGTRHSD